MSLINDLENMITKASALRKQAEPTAAQMDPNYRPANYKPIGSEGRLNSPAYQASQQQSGAAINQSSGGNPASRQQYTGQAKQREQQRIQQNTGQAPQRSPIAAGVRAGGTSLAKSSPPGVVYQGYKAVTR